MNNYYVYALCYPNGEPFYIGKGQGNRINEHENEVKKNRNGNTYKQAVIKKIQQTGQQIAKQKLAEFSCELDAYMYEWALIHMSTYSENLTNLHGATVHYKLVELRPKKLVHLKTQTGYFTASEVATMLGKSPRAIVRLIKKGKLAGAQTGPFFNSTYHISQEAIDAFFQPLTDTDLAEAKEKNQGMSPNQFEFIPIEEAAEQLHVHIQTLRRAIAKGELQAYRLGKGYQVTEEALQKYIESKTVGGTNGNHSERLSESHS